MSPDRDRLRRRLQKLLTRQLEECEQCVRDMNYWNGINPHETPLDPEWFIVQAAGIRKALAAIAANERIDPDWLQTE